MQKVVLITGVSSGFGKAIAERLLAQGHIVYGTSRRNPDFDLNGLRIKHLDVTQKDVVNEVVGSIVEEQGHLDVLINNAGIGIAGAAELATEQEIDLQMNTNFMGVVNMCSAVLPHFRARRRGTVLNVSSIGGVFTIPYQGFYSVSKFAVEAYSEALALETRQFGINIVIVEPGDFNTGFTNNRKVSEVTLRDEDYKASFDRVLRNIEKDERGGGDPKYLARKIAKIINKKSPKFRYLITPNIVQRLSVTAHGILPNRMFQWILRLFYGV